MSEQLSDNPFKPIVCVYCTKYITFIEFDMEQHLVENHRLFSSYCNTRSPTMERAITDGKRLGLTTNPTLLQQLNKDFLTHQSITKYAGIHPDWIPAPTSDEVIQKIREMKPWSEVRTQTFTPVVTVEQFFNEDLPLPLVNHPLEKSPCFPIINFKPAGKYILYFCELHPQPENTNCGGNVNLASIEHHIRYDNAKTHKEEIISRMNKVK